MPMSFPDMASLIRLAEMRHFRKPNDGETEEEYRHALYVYTLPKDPVEAAEIRTGKPWDTWNEGEKLGSLVDAILSSKMKNK